MKLTVRQPFIGHGFDYPQPGTLIEVADPLGRHLCDIGVCVPYETKIDEPPVAVKKKEPSASLPADPAPAKKTRKRSKRSATKSSS